MDSATGTSKNGFVENRSIDFIPENERHGRYSPNLPFGLVLIYRLQQLSQVL